MTVLCEVSVSYSQFTLGSRDDPTPGMRDAFAGQANGLCGAAVEGGLFLVTSLHTGTVPVTVAVLDSEPALPAGWSDVVEVSLVAAQSTVWVLGWGGDSFDEIDLRAPGVFRVRYCARGFAADRETQTRPDGETPVEEYLLQLWPAPAAPDRVIATSGPAAQYWHDHARSLPTPPSAREQAEAQQARAELELAARQRNQAEHLRREWGGRAPTRRLLEVGGDAQWIARHDRDLLDRFEALSPGTQRQLARWLARRAFQHAGIDHNTGAAAALEAMDRGAPLPAPFTDPAEAFHYLWAQETVQPGPASIGMAVSTLTGITAAHPGWGEDEDGNIHRPSFALPALFAATHTDPLRAVIDAFHHTMATFRGHRQELLHELQQRLATP